MGAAFVGEGGVCVVLLLDVFTLASYGINGDCIHPRVTLPSDLTRRRSDVDVTSRR